ncbi:MAG: metallophosphoesterase [Pseudomonadales bacterium]
MKDHQRQIQLRLLFVLMMASCQTATVQAGELTQRLILLGDAGYSEISPLEPTLQLAADLASQIPTKTATLFLGDNIYKTGFPVLKEKQTTFNSQQLKEISYLTAQLQVAKLSTSRLYLLPGNHDWKPKQVDDQAAYIAKYAQQQKLQAHFVPYSAGHDPLPEIVTLEGVSILFLDSSWMLQGDGKNLSLALSRLKTLINHSRSVNPNNLLLIASHHPIESLGAHAGYRHADKRDPSSPIIRKDKTGKGNLADPGYQQMIAGLQETVAGMERVIFAAGHDHSLQVFESTESPMKRFHLVSGAANKQKISAVGDAPNRLYGRAATGLMVIDIETDRINLKVYTTETKSIEFEKELW